MRRIAQILILAACAAVVIQVIALNRATGGKVWTRYPDPQIEQMKAFDADAMLFYDPALDGPDQKPQPTDNSFRFGWLPAGPGKFLLSVATFSLPAILIGMVALWPSKKT